MRFLVRRVAALFVVAVVLTGAALLVGCAANFKQYDHDVAKCEWSTSAYTVTVEESSDTTHVKKPKTLPGVVAACHALGVRVGQALHDDTIVRP